MDFPQRTLVATLDSNSPTARGEWLATLSPPLGADQALKAPGLASLPGYIARGTTSPSDHGPHLHLYLGEIAVLARLHQHHHTQSMSMCHSTTSTGTSRLKEGGVVRRGIFAIFGNFPLLARVVTATRERPEPRRITVDNKRLILRRRPAAIQLPAHHLMSAMRDTGTSPRCPGSRLAPH